ncbi:IS66 family insertion sequence element accessory protein TnpB [Rhizobium leguminosarum]|uniref:IS66 family insertion sequence element accessory protein TnpB n=1 Tax=Rhizobium leguminosarum TaxID=384 RepID=UPI003F9AA3F2
MLSLVRDAGSDPFNGALYVFRAKRADRVKIVWWDGSGVCLYAKRLEKAQFLRRSRLRSRKAAVARTANALRGHARALRLILSASRS